MVGETVTEMSRERFDTGGVLQDGLLKLRHRKRFDEAMKEMRDGEVIVSIRRARATRSLQANALYWSGYIAPLADHTGYSPAWVHAYLKKRFLTPNHMYIADRDGVIVDEQDLEPTTTTLTKLEFSDYLSRIEEFALELGVIVGPRERELVHE